MVIQSGFSTLLKAVTVWVIRTSSCHSDDPMLFPSFMFSAFADKRSLLKLPFSFIPSCICFFLPCMLLFIAYFFPQLTFNTLLVSFWCLQLLFQWNSLSCCPSHLLKLGDVRNEGLFSEHGWVYKLLFNIRPQFGLHCAENGRGDQIQPLPGPKRTQVYGTALIMVDEQVKKWHLESEQLLRVLRVIEIWVNFWQSCLDRVNTAGF